MVSMCPWLGKSTLLFTSDPPPWRVPTCHAKGETCERACVLVWVYECVCVCACVCGCLRLCGHLYVLCVCVCVCRFVAKLGSAHKAGPPCAFVLVSFENTLQRGCQVGHSQFLLSSSAAVSDNEFWVQRHPNQIGCERNPQTWMGSAELSYRRSVSCAADLI